MGAMMFASGLAVVQKTVFAGGGCGIDEVLQ
jgi:hypothetical protein